jgi:hypothetical protein
MSDNATFTFSMRGPNAHLRSIRERIEEGICIECMLDGDGIVTLPPKNWGRWSKSRKDFGSFNINDPGSFCTLYRNKLTLSGVEAPWLLPIEVAERITNLYPRVVVATSTEVELEYGDDWESSAGRGRRVRAWWWDQSEKDWSKWNKDRYSEDAPDPMSKWQSVQKALRSKSKSIRREVCCPPKVRVAPKRRRSGARKPGRKH